MTTDEQEMGERIRGYVARYHPESIHLKDGPGTLCGIISENTTDVYTAVTCPVCLCIKANTIIEEIERDLIDEKA